MTALHSPSRRTSFVFSYDISSPKRSRAVRRCLRGWRLDGQKSVHETRLTPREAATLGDEICDLLDPGADNLLVFRLSARGDGPIYAVSTLAPAVPFAHQSPPPPAHLHSGWYVLAYDVTDKRRLRRVQRIMSRETIFLQRSVYLFRGSGRDLWSLLHETRRILKQDEDDLRLYALASVEDLWFLCGPIPPLDGLPDTPLEFCLADA